MGINRSNTIADVEAALSGWKVLGRHESIQDVPFDKPILIYKNIASPQGSDDSFIILMTCRRLVIGNSILFVLPSYHLKARTILKLLSLSSVILSWNISNLVSGLIYYG